MKNAELKVIKFGASDVIATSCQFTGNAYQIISDGTVFYYNGSMTSGWGTDVTTTDGKTDTSYGVWNYGDGQAIPGYYHFNEADGKYYLCDDKTHQ